MSAPAIALSVVVTGRNDGYGGDFTARFLRTLRFNTERLTAADVRHEIVLVEWAPPRDRPLLVDLVREALPPALAGVVRAFLVDARYQEACTLNPKLRYLEYLAKNVGIRRSRGQMVLATNTDIYFSRGVITAIAGAQLPAGTVHRARRVDVKLGADETRVDWDLLEDERNQHAQRPLKPPLLSGASGDFILLDRASWHALGGFNEVYRLARVGVDVNFLAKAYASGYPIADIGAPVYHTNHVGSYQLSKTSVRGDASQAAWGTQWPSHAVIYENPPAWGLAAAPERTVSPGTTWLDFDWGAVPPLVALRRIVLAGARAGHPDVQPAED